MRYDMYKRFFKEKYGLSLIMIDKGCVLQHNREGVVFQLFQDENYDIVMNLDSSNIDIRLNLIDFQKTPIKVNYKKWFPYRLKEIFEDNMFNYLLLDVIDLFSMIDKFILVQNLKKELEDYTGFDVVFSCLSDYKVSFEISELTFVISDKNEKGFDYIYNKNPKNNKNKIIINKVENSFKDIKEIVYYFLLELSILNKNSIFNTIKKEDIWSYRSFISH